MPTLMEVVALFNLLATVLGFFAAWNKLTNAMTRIETRLDGVESNMKRIEETLNKDVQKLERIVQAHGEKIARIEAKLGGGK
jgi:hypothetical protein